MNRTHRKKTLDEFLSVTHVTDPRTLKPNYKGALKKKMEEFQDMKFGVFIHYGLYSEASTMESWLMNKSSQWARDFDPKYKEMFDGDDDKYIQWYLDTQKRMNPSKFNAKEWMDLIEEAGMKYLGFTSKHHDGYCLFDSKYSDFKITNEHSKKKIDMLKEVFQELDKRNIGKWLYFSKADWTAPTWQGPCYYEKNDPYIDHSNAPVIVPEILDEFNTFFKNQLLKELLVNYGRVDCIWLDTGFMKAENGYDIQIDKTIEEARKLQEGLIVVDRANENNEDYWTPENTLISEPVTNVPWEAIITLGGHWGFTTWDKYNDEHWVIDALLTTISNGGNLCLGVGPKGDGSFTDESIRILKEVGEFNKLNSEGIYATRAVAPYHDKQAYFTQSKDGNTIYAFVHEDIKEFVIPVEFKEYKNALDVKGKTLEINDNKIVIANDKPNKFEFKMIKLKK